MDLSPAEIEAFDGLNQSYIEMVEQTRKNEQLGLSIKGKYKNFINWNFKEKTA